MPLPPIPYNGPKRRPFWPNPRPTLSYLQGDVPSEVLIPWGYEPYSPLNTKINTSIKVDYDSSTPSLNVVANIQWNESLEPINRQIVSNRYDSNQPFPAITVIAALTSWQESYEIILNRIKSSSVNGEPLVSVKKSWIENQDLKPNTRIKTNSINGEPLVSAKKSWIENQDLKPNTRIKIFSVNGEPLPRPRPIFWGYESQYPNTRIKLNQKITYNGEPLINKNNFWTDYQFTKPNTSIRLDLFNNEFQFVIVNAVIWIDNEPVKITPKYHFTQSNGEPLPSFVNPFILQYWLQSSGGDDSETYEPQEIDDYVMQELEIQYKIDKRFIPKTDKKKRIEKNRARIAKTKRMSNIKKILSGGASAIILYKTIKKVIE